MCRPELAPEPGQGTAARRRRSHEPSCPVVGAHMATRLRRTAAIVTLGLLAAFVPGSQAGTTAGFHIAGTQLLDANGRPFVMRAINHLSATSRAETTQALADIKATGANAVRLTVTGKD